MLEQEPICVSVLLVVHLLGEKKCLSSNWVGCAGIRIRSKMLRGFFVI